MYDEFKLQNQIIDTLKFFGPLTAEGINHKLRMRGHEYNITNIDTQLANLQVSNSVKKTKNEDLTVTFKVYGGTK